MVQDKGNRGKGWRDGTGDGEAWGGTLAYYVRAGKPVSQGWQYTREQEGTYRGGGGGLHWRPLSADGHRGSFRSGGRAVRGGSKKSGGWLLCKGVRVRVGVCQSVCSVGQSAAQLGPAKEKKGGGRRVVLGLGALGG